MMPVEASETSKLGSEPRRGRARGSLALAMVALAFALFVEPQSATLKADSGWGCQATFQDANADGRRDLAVLAQCHFGSDNDTVYIHDRAGNMDAGSDWEDAVDFSDDLWAFDIESDGAIDLLVDFYSAADGLVADLYDRRGGRGVAYSAAEPDLARRLAHPTVRVVAPDGWWLRDGKVNFNLRILIDGPVVGSFDAPVYTGFLSSDGAPDFAVTLRDTDGDGRPDYELIQCAAVRLRGYRGLTSTFLIVNEADNEWPLEDYVFWPYIGGTHYGFVKPYRESPPPIQIRWQEGTIEAVGEFVASHGGDHNWYIQSHAPFGAQGDPTYADFENPFAFYDLAADDDGFPELAIRMEYMGAAEFYSTFGGSFEPRQAVRYSWDQGNDQSWDYKVDLVGRHEIVETVHLPGFAVQTVPYAEYPGWVTRRTWDTCIFVAVEGESYWSSEGIYEGYSRSWRDAYVGGIVDEPDLSEVEDVTAGLRQEYTPELRGQPWLYLSSVDGRLHLRGAWAGVWNVDDAHRVRYEDTDRDGYLDTWTVTRSVPVGEADSEAEEQAVVEDVLASLHTVGGFLIYGHAHGVKVVRRRVPASLFETLPPTDHEVWQSLSEQLQRHGRDFAADDLAGMLAQFDGPTTEIEGAAIEGLRLTEDGYRFELHLRPGFRVVADQNDLQVASLAPDSYLVNWDGAFHIQPLTPPHVTLAQGQLSCEPAAPQQMAWTTIRAVLHNGGLRDVESLPVSIYAAARRGEPQLLGEYDLALTGGGEQVLEQRWWPREAGPWTIWVEADIGRAVPTDTRLGTLASLVITVDPAHVPHMLRLAAAYDGVHLTWPVALLLSAVGLAVVCVGWHVLRQLASSAGVGPGPGEPE